MSRNPAPVAIAVEFEVLRMDAEPGSRMKRERVELADVATFHAAHGGWVQRVLLRWHDGSESWSWGKSWVMSDTGVLVRIGAGAYGDLTVWEAPKAA